MEGQSKGKSIRPNDAGRPVLVDAPAPTAQQIQMAKNAQAREYLASTDWYVVRKMETGVEIPQDVLDTRSAARAAVVE
jgi:hypothetical protein